MRQGDEVESACGLNYSSKLGKEYVKDPILSPYLFNLICRIHHARCQAV